MQRLFLMWIGLVVVAILSISGVYLYQHSSKPQTPTINVQTNTNDQNLPPVSDSTPTQALNPAQVPTPTPISTPAPKDQPTVSPLPPAPLPLKNCKVTTYQDSFYFVFGNSCLDTMKMHLVYFIAKDQKSEIIPNWSLNMKNIYNKVGAFYQSQLSNKIQISISEPQIVYGDKNIGEYATAYSVGQEARNKLNLKTSSDYFTNLTVFYHSALSSGGYNGATSLDGSTNGSISLNPWFWLESDGMCTLTTESGTACYSYVGSAHEFGHALGIPHPWEMDINKNSNGIIINNSFHAGEEPNVMANGSSKLLSGNVNDPLGGYYLMNEAKEKMIVK